MMKGEMREEARTKDGKRERQDSVKRKEGRKVSRGVRRHLSVTHSCHLASMCVNVFSFVNQTAGHKHNS